jgi:hypothetical protein
MKQGFLPVFCIFLILLFISAAACVAPPKSSGTQSAGSSKTAGQGAGGAGATETPTPGYVILETPYGATAPPTQAPTATTALPEEWVEIYRDTRSYGYNTTAFSFDLKNPPMFVNLTFLPVNVTGTKVVTSRYGSKEEITVRYDYYSPYAWFEITVRDKDSGRILLKDGFGNSYGKQYSAELNRTMKVLNRANLHIEMSGNQLTAKVDMHVKKEGNINNATIP